MHDARAVANFFLDRAESRQQPLTSMTLLKVLYFAHAWHLAKNDTPLVAQPFEAWKYGPVSRVVYDQLKDNGRNPIKKKLVSFDASLCAFKETVYNFDSDLTNFLTHIYDYYSNFQAYELSDLTHEKGSPWDVIWKLADSTAVPGMFIPNGLIKEWFLREYERSNRPRS